MPRTLLQWVGALFVLGLFGASMFALAVVKDRVRIVVAPDEAAAGPDPTALLRDDLQTVARDVADLRTALAANFERLGTALEERAEARQGELRALARDVAALRQRADATHDEVLRWQGRLQELSARVAAGQQTTTAPPVEPPAPAPVATPPAVEPVPAPPEPAAAADAGRTTGFLSFSVPTTAFRFDERNEYVLVPELCRVGFDAKSTLHDFSGVTSKVTGRFTADLDDREGAWSGEIACEAGTLLTGVEGRDANMWEHLDTKKHPAIRFVISRFAPADGGIDVVAQTVRGDVVGTMTIRGVSRELRMPVTLEVDASKRVVVKGQAPLLLSDYGVPVPSQLGVINMQDQVVVWVALRARVRTGGAR